MQVTAAPFPSSSRQTFYIASSVIRGPTHFSWLFLNNFPFVYAYNNFTNSLHEGTLDFYVLFYTVTNLPARLTRLAGGIFAPHLGIVAPLKHG